MSLTDDLALVTACRDALGKTTPGPWMVTDYEPEGEWDRAVYAAHDDVPVALVWGEADALPIAAVPDVYDAALSLIEDTLNRHAIFCSQCNNALRLYRSHGIKNRRCPDYERHLTALHAIATALGVEKG